MPMGKVRVYWRLIVLLTSMLAYLSVIIGRQIVRGKHEPFALRIRQKWTALAVSILGIKVSVKGQLPDHHGLVVSNHKCLIDPVIILSKLIVIPVSKAEIAKYPLIGKAADITGILFLSRKDKDSHKATREGIRTILKRELSILIFPEGTTYSQPGLRDFKKGSFEIAAEENIAVIPLAIQYGHPDMIWQESESTWQHFNRCFQHATSEVTVHVGPVIKNDLGQQMLHQSRQFILQALGQAGPE